MRLKCNRHRLRAHRLVGFGRAFKCPNAHLRDWRCCRQPSGRSSCPRCRQRLSAPDWIAGRNDAGVERLDERAPTPRALWRLDRGQALATRGYVAMRFRRPWLLRISTRADRCGGGKAAATADGEGLVWVVDMASGRAAGRVGVAKKTVEVTRRQELATARSVQPGDYVGFARNGGDHRRLRVDRCTPMSLLLEWSVARGRRCGRDSARLNGPCRPWPSACAPRTATIIAAALCTRTDMPAPPVSSQFIPDGATPDDPVSSISRGARPRCPNPCCAKPPEMLDWHGSGMGVMEMSPAARSSSRSPRRLQQCCFAARRAGHYKISSCRGGDRENASSR